MNKNLPEDFEKTLCKNCSHKKADHYTFSRIPERESIPGQGCKECDCKKFLSKEITKWINQPKHETEWKNESKHKTEWTNLPKHETRWKNQEKS